MSTQGNQDQRGFALVASLLLLILISAVAVTLVFDSNNESRIGSADLQDNIAAYAAEGAMEKMANDISSLYAVELSPAAGDISALNGTSTIVPSSGPPSLSSNVKFNLYTLTPVTNASGNLAPVAHQISSGPNAGLTAEIEDINLTAITQMIGSNEQVKMNRTVEVALIPVFQFGVFSNTDLSYHAGANFNFAGRVHTNGNLFIAENACCTLTFQDKITVVKDIVREQLDNGLNVSTSNPAYSGNVFGPTSSPGCVVTAPAVPTSSTPSCRQLALNEGSVTAGPGSAATANWTQISLAPLSPNPGGYNGTIVNGKTGATALTLPFAKQGVSPISMIQQPLPGENPLTPIGQSRMFNQAQIRILLADTPADLPGGVTQAGDVQLENTNAAFNKNGIAITGAASPYTPAYFATGNTVNTDPGWTVVPPAGSTVTTTASTFPLITGWLRVEVRLASGAGFKNVTQEWLNLGFGRGLQSPDLGHAIPNIVHPNAILILQQLADRNLDGQTTDTTANANEVMPTASSNSQYYWYPINLYDNREGAPRDVNNVSATDPTLYSPQCYAGGVMNAVELDVANLQQWLLGKIGSSGTLVENQSQNGYVLYFSDRRGMLANPNPALNPSGAKFGDYGFNDVTNIATASGIPPNGTLDPGEDIYGDGRLSNYGAVNVGTGFGLNTTKNPYVLIPSCSTTARKYRVTGARHALKLIDGTLGKVPTKPDGTGGFTVVSEQPVYVQGNYNANDNGFGNTLSPPAAHSASAIIADSVTMLSNNWTDAASLEFPQNPNLPDASTGPCPNALSNPPLANVNFSLAAAAPPGSGVSVPTTTSARAACNTYWRVAVASGKSLSFPNQNWPNGSTDDGTDGGIHNFLRFVEAWSGLNQATANYMGSMVSFYYSQYATGIFKCCNTVYTAPNRAYAFDTDFLNPTKLPPGTPRLIDIVNLSSTQDFTPQ